MGFIQIQFRKGTASEWAAANPTLARAEIGVETDTGLFKIGNGSNNWNSLAYSSTYWSSLIGTPTGLISSSEQLPSGTVSSSNQVNYFQLNNLPSGIVSQSSQINVLNTIGISALATTASNLFVGDQTISGSLIISNNLTVLGSSSISYVSQSVLNIGTNVITVNANSPSVRFGGLEVIDSGSIPQVSGSLYFDSIKNRWIFVHANSAGQVTSSALMMHPQTYNDIGNEVILNQNTIPKGLGEEHLGNSQITDDGTTVYITNSLIVGTLISSSLFSGSFLGNLTGTSTSASNALTSSYAVSSSYGASSDFAISSSNANSASFSSFSLDGLTAISASYSTTASYALNARDSSTSNVRIISSSDVFLQNDSYIIVSSGFVTMSLPIAANVIGKEYSIKNSGTGMALIQPSGSDTIDGYSTMTISEQNSLLGVVSIGSSGWVIF